MKIEFNTHSIIWKYKFISTMNNDVQLISSCLYSSSNNMIYSLTVFGGSQSAVLFILNSLSGSLAHSPLKLSTPIYQSSGIIFVDNIIYFTTYSPINSYLVVLNTQSYSSTVYTFSGLNIYRIGITFDSSRFIFVGNKNANAYLAKARSNQFDYDPYLSPSHITMVDASASYSLYLDTGTTLAIYLCTFSLNLAGPTASTLSLVSSLDSDISYNCGSINQLSLTPNMAKNIPIDLSCSLSGATDITYTLQPISPTSMPSWLTFDAANRLIKANTTNVLPGSIVTLQIVSTSSASTSICRKSVSLEVMSCNVANCTVCKSENPNSCLQCANGLCSNNNDTSTIKGNSTSTSNSEISSSTSEKASIATQSVVGAAAGATMIFSFCNLSTPQGIWMAMNQFQLILLLLLTNSHIPNSIVEYLSGLKASTCSLNFIPFKDIPGFKWIIDSLDHELENKNLTYFGIKSGSTLSNNFSLVCTIAIISLFHLCYLCVFKKLMKKFSNKEKLLKIFEKIYQLFAFTIYLRLILEASQFLMLSCFEELKSWNVSNASRIISLCIAMFATLICISLIILSFLNWYKNKNIESTNHYMPFKELFGGIKDQSKPRLYSTVLLSRRTFLVILLVMGSSITSIGIIIPMIIVQFLYLVLMVIVRPYKAIKDNLLEITNEV